MFKKTKKDKPSYGLIGLGRFGTALALELAASGAELLVLDKDEEKIRELREITENAMVVKTLDKKTLEATGIQNCNVAVVCASEQLDMSILTTLNLVSLGIPMVISKAASAEHGEILEKLGAHVVYPERDMGIRLARRLESSATLDFVQLSKRVNISKQTVSQKMVGKTVLEVDLRKRFSLNIIAIENNGAVVESIHPNYVFREGDILFVAGSLEGMNRFTEWTEKN